MKIIVDTNVLVSAVLKGREPRAVVQFIIDNTTCDWIVSEEILAEYKEVLSRSKFKLTSEIRLQWLEILDTVTTLIEVNEEIDFLRDKKDAKFLACAVAAEADFLITGDSDFNEARSLVKTTIISVSLFKRLVCDLSQHC
ncbi:putative toxin-antitoxin system toxin component, PIN family [Aetokthonos hydrillicola Thurmond2011]|jgi:putative PIN family toxin of toxin-antitoxin system|uniref:Toxin-antitoxin system toxin component, PIN family n=1 Tax=Aetokthonos hydrillicola Thurmond2011 TaxID=2712845 RepID=A0AAP5M333_9CYAN|nr:putative toxin-antitoxin system toxin component, PIN family [Aetokthonos hydrillicola]MBO3463906.1 putative toxin-antitoxin system toxin component, PIN family [Aetokthonos hydrillicola CCALA 1050]MBW4590216.1 putative toxin-antitoxin system toxin component, PIN family [Aetokthonos hydrillicola CCALA 1050]MDR9893361.1 putative toxin-antitoxin system toxin component, PIN family [Aetokthonos hydrillicola Thurmond2011]